MPEIVNCPQCERKLRVPDDLFGQPVKCPTCGMTFTAAPPVADVEPVAPRSEGEPPRAPAPEPQAEPYDLEPERPVSRRRPRRYADTDYEDDEDDYYEPRRRRQRWADLEPHRGSVVLTLGIISLIICGPILGPIAWVMGNNDLQAMRAGRMDPEGEGLTNAGRICGMIGTILSIAVLTLYCLFAAALGIGGAAGRRF